MGRASRRKKLALNYETGIVRKTQPKLYTHFMGDVGRTCYLHYGRGILLNMPGLAPRYALPTCSWLKSTERDLIYKYDPETEVVMAEFNLQGKLFPSRRMAKMTIKSANNFRIGSTWDNIEEVVNNMFVANAENEPKD